MTSLVAHGEIDGSTAREAILLLQKINKYCSQPTLSTGFRIKHIMPVHETRNKQEITVNPFVPNETYAEVK